MRDLPKIKLKYLCKSFSSALIARELKTDIQEGYPVFGAAGLMGYKDTYDLESEYLGIVKDGAGVGRINIYPAKSSLLGTMAAIIPNPNVSISWLKYAITSLNLGESVDKATIPHIYFSVYGNSFIWDISKEMQQAIADILDRKCTQIDALIANEEQQIAKLKAYKQSVITETVTKGLDPDVPMKDSGVEWIGEIPEHWTIAPIRSLFRIKKDIIGHEPETVLSITQNGLKVKDITENSGQMANSYDHYQIVNLGDFAMNHMDLLTGGVGISEFEGVTSPDYRVFVMRNKKMNPRYFLYIFQMYYRNKIFYAFGQGAANLGRWRLPAQNFNTIAIPLAPITEQNEIVSLLDKKCEQIDRLIAIKQKKIEKLQQYKKSVIYEYVTGKRESVDTNVVFFNPLTAKALLLCKIIDFLGDQLRGRIQALKCLFLIEDCVGINFNTQYFRFKHGPYTPDIVNIEKCCMENEWLTVSIVNNHYEYHIGNNHCYYSDKYDKIFGTNNSEIEKVLSFIKGMKTSEVERVATLFAVWNDMIIAGTNSPSDSEIIFEVRNNWTPNKANCPVSTWQNTLDKMRKAGITPKGYGLHTMKKENENEQL